MHIVYSIQPIVYTVNSIQPVMYTAYNRYSILQKNKYGVIATLMYGITNKNMKTLQQVQNIMIGVVCLMGPQVQGGICRGGRGDCPPQWFSVSPPLVLDFAS